MKVILFLLLLIIVIICYTLLRNRIEYFSDILDDTKKILGTPFIANNNNINCCLVEKKFLPGNNIFGGNFKYIFKKLSNDDCNMSLYRLDSNKQLLIDGENNWSNKRCKSGTLGSCRNINKECIDFVDKKFCDKYKMTWSNKTCHDKLDYKWIDRIKRNLPKNNQSYVFRMFKN